jgi:hypothetical protein
MGSKRSISEKTVRAKREMLNNIPNFGARRASVPRGRSGRILSKRRRVQRIRP